MTEESGAPQASQLKAHQRRTSRTVSPKRDGCVDKAVKRESLKLAYLIYGREELLLSEALERLKERLNDGSDVLDYDDFRASDVSAKKIVDVARTAPFLSSKRLVVVREAEQLSVGDISTLASYLDNPSPFACLVLVASALRKENKLFQVFDVRGAAYEYKPPLPNQYPTWIKNEFLKRNKKVSTEVANFVFLNVGKDLGRLRSEIEKICLFCKEKEEISLLEIEAVTTKSAQSSIFDLVDAIGKRSEKKAFAILNSLLEAGEDYYHIFHMIVRQFRLLLITKAFLDKGSTEVELAKKLRLPSFIVRKYIGQAKNFSLKQLKQAYQYFLETDLSLKTSKKDPKLALEALLYKILTDE